MAMFDTVRRRASLDNSIEGVTIDPNAPKATDTPSTDAPATSEPAPKPPEFDKLYAEPAGKKTKYYSDYTRKDLAVTISDNAISSKKQDAKTIGMMVKYAESQGWSQVKVSGTEDFRREAWIEAHMRGIEAKGYKATEPDRQEARRRAAEQGVSIPDNKVAADGPALAPAPATAKPEAVAPSPAPATAKAAPEAAQSKTATLSPAAAARANLVDEYLRGKEAFITGKGQHPPEDKGIEAGMAKVAKEFVDEGRAYTRFDVAKEFRARDAREFAAADKPAIREGMTAAEHRTVLRSARAELSPDGKLALDAFSSKIDKEMNQLNNEKKAELKAHAAIGIRDKERTEGQVSLTKEQRDHTTAKATPAQERENLKAHQAKLQSHIESAKRTVSDKVIERFDGVSHKLDTSAPKPKQATAPKAATPKPQTPAAPKRTRSIGR